MRLKKLFLMSLMAAAFVLLPSIWHEASAQMRTVSGTVTESTASGIVPVVGAGVIVKNSPSTGAATDINGRYTINVPSNRDVTLVFSSIGYADQEVEVGSRSVVDVTLSASTEFIEDVVVVGYGVQKRSDVAGSVASIKSDELFQYPASSMAELMRGKAAGVQVSIASGAPGSTSTIKIRGTRSLLDGSNVPMYVIDGVVASELEFNSLSPEEVESIEILKDAASQAIYGARAANGVIMVTTKRGNDESPVITFNSSHSVQKLWRNFDFYSPEEFYELRKQAVAHDWNYDTESQIATLTPADVFADDVMEKAYKEGHATDWESLMLKPALMQKYELSVRGGSRKIKYSTTVGYLDHKGMCVLESRFNRANVRFNADYKAKDWLTIGMSTSYIKINNKKEPGTFNDYITTPAWGVPFEDDGVTPTKYINSSQDANPLWNGRNTRNEVNNDIYRISGYVEIVPFRNLTYKLNLGTANRFRENASYRTSDFTRDGASGEISNTKYHHDTIENILNYNVPFSNEDHSLNLTAVQSYEYDLESGTGYVAGNVPEDAFWWNMLPDGTNKEMSRPYSEYRLLSYLARAQYSYKGRYLINLALRRDGSSRFGQSNKWGNFPSVSAAWRVSQEPWMKNVQWVSNLKFRASYGLVGNQNGIGNYETLGTADSYQYEFGDKLRAGYLPGKTLTNDRLMWESTASANFGVDFGLFNNRLNGTVEYYNTYTNNLLFPRQINSALGYSSVTDNVAKTNTKGVDINLSADLIRKKDMFLSVGVIYSWFRNKIVRLSGELDSEGKPIDDITNKWFIGEPINVYYDYLSEGIYQYEDFNGQDETGKWILKNTVDTDKDGVADAPLQRDDAVSPGVIKIIDKNTDGIINASDRYVIKRDPDFVGSFNTTFRYRGFEMYMDWYGVYGSIRSNSYLTSPSHGGSLQGKQNGIKVNYWTPSNPSNEFPRPSLNSNARFMSSLSYQNSSYLRLRTLSFGYALPAKVANTLSVKNAKITFTGTNLVTFTKFLSYSPETLAGDYPEAQQYTVSLQLTF